MDNVCNRRLFSIPSKVKKADKQEYLRCMYEQETGFKSNKPSQDFGELVLQEGR